MSVFYDRAVRGLITGIFFAVLLMVMSDILIGICFNYRSKNIMLQQKYSISSSLIENGVEENIIAKALVNEKDNDEGIALVNKLGFEDNYGYNVLPLSAAIKIISVSLCLFSVVICFAVKRNKLYENALNDIDNCRDISVSYKDKGNIYRLFAGINNMMEALRAKGETEQSTKEFLKQTISDISHQLKTPLSALSMYNELILGEPGNVSAVTEFTQKSGIAIDRINELILMLLKITRLDASAVEFNKKTYCAEDVILKAVENLTKRAEQEGKKINIRCNAEKINCDIDWTGEAIGNIVKNALDHTSDNGIINIECESTPLENRIYISDNGSGIDNEDYHHIFKRFYRSKNSSDTQGIGLGLPFAKTVVEKQGGIISVESEKGRGSVFILSFPNLTEM